MHIIVESPVVATPRVQQVRGMFDLPSAQTSRVEWNVQLPLDAQAWNVGLIVGPSGCGKSTVGRHLFPELRGIDMQGRPPEFGEWTGRGTVVDAFPQGTPIKDVAALLSAVGLASPPAWLRPFHVLSTGQQFRVTLALRLAYAAQGERILFDEYTSVVDRTVAQIGSAALAKLVRSRKQQFVALTCHEDVEAWLQPDWVYRPAENNFAWRLLRRRPPIELDVVRCRASAWRLFAPHHYLSHRLNPSSVCFLASWLGRPVAFSAWLSHRGVGPKTRREHRTVTLSDYQGAGIGNALSDFVASLWAGLGYRARSTTTHPAMMRSRHASPHWHMHRAPAFAPSQERGMKHATTRLTASFTYIGPPLPPAMARALLGT